MIAQPHKKVCAGLAAFTVMLAPAPLMRAADTHREVFVRIEQSNDPADVIAGGAIAAGFERWIKAVSIGHGFDVLPSHAQGRARVPSLGDFTIVKKADRSTPVIMKTFLAGRQLRKVTVVQTAKREGESMHAPVKVELGNVTISDVHLSSGAFDRVYHKTQTERPTEEVSFTYDRVRWVYTPRGAQGMEPPVQSEFDALLGSGDPAQDTDMDGVPNSQDTDDDGDGIPDHYELAFGLEPLFDDADDDRDGDGQSNRGEFAAGTAADDACSYFSISSMELSLTEQSTTIVFPILPLRRYQILGSSDGQSWTEMTRFTIPGNSNEHEAEVVIPISGKSRMLRVSVSVPATE